MSIDVGDETTMDAPLICFEGPIGAGKTTLASLLGGHTGYEVILERFNENDYLADFYSDQLRWALPMQLWFLADRHRQFAELAGTRTKPIIADYSPLKNDVFASLLLSGRDWRLYQSLSSSLSRVHEAPRTIVYLDARDDVLLNRIAKRSRPYEAHIDANYLQGIRQSYQQLLKPDSSVRLVTFDTSELDLTSEAEMMNFYDGVMTDASK